MLKRGIIKAQIIGYVLAGLGIIGLLLSFEKPRSFIPFFQNVSSSYIIISAMVFVVLGVILMVLYGREKAEKEVPIYKGKKIVGYRRH